MIMDHVNEEQLIGYVHRTLTDAEREALDAHLVNCQGCRTRLAAHQARQRQIHQELGANIRAARPLSTMSFAQIEPRLRSKNRWVQTWRAAFDGLTTLAAPTGLAVAVVGVWGLEPYWSAETAPAPANPFLLLAGLFLGLAVVSQYRHRSLPPRTLLTAPLTFILWLGTAVIGLYNLIIIRDLIIIGYANYVIKPGSLAGPGTNAYWRSVTVGNFSLLLLAMLWIAVIVGLGEYHFKHIGQRSSWKLFAWTVAVQLTILILPLLWW